MTNNGGKYTFDKLENGKNYFVKLGTKLIPGVVTEILHTIDVNTGEEKKADSISKNEIAVCKVSFGDSIVVDEFKNHKTLGELILIDRVTNMTSACGVVAEVHTDESNLSDHKVNKQTRSALKGQVPVTVEFSIDEDGITLELAENVEKLLSSLGRHTYLYEPEQGEAIEEVVTHLNNAGIVVLLVVEKKEVVPETLRGKEGYYSSWREKVGVQAEDIAEFVRKKSAYSGQVAKE